jgi:replicative DNA helicase
MEPVTALVVDAENTAKQWMRATRWMVKQAVRTVHVDPSPRIHMALSGRLNLLDPTVLGDIHRMIDQHKPGLVFMGPLYRLALQMNTDEQIAPVIAALDSIRDRGVALVIEAHAGHAVGVNGIRDVRPRGSSALLGWPEFGYGIRKDTSDGASPTAFEFVSWRGARETRAWPSRLRRGNWELGDWPWLVDEEWQ